MNRYLMAMQEESLAMLSGKFIPYHIAAFMMAILTTLIFSITMTHSTVFEGKVAVIDLDSSKFSTTLIESLNTSAYIEITEVYHSAIDVSLLLQHDRNIGVLYIPKGLEKAVLRSDSTFNLGYFADYSNLAQNGQAIANLKKMITQIGSETTGAKISIAQGISAENSKALMLPMDLIDRELFNPTQSSTINICSAFIYFFSSILLGLTMVMLVGRLKITNRWHEVMHDDVIVLICRIVPYALIYTTAISLVTSAIVVFGQMRFNGNYFMHVPSIFMTAMGIGMLGIMVTWNTTQPGEGGSKMILIVPPGFIMGGALLASGMLPEWVNTVKFAFPLTWQYEFWRDFAYRGTSTLAMLGSYGRYLLYLTALATLLGFIHHISSKKYLKNEILQKALEEQDLKAETQA